jgi:hypothetical protein
MKLSSSVMLSSLDAKLSSCVAAELSLLLVVVEQSLAVAAAVEQSLAIAAVELSLVVAMAELAAIVVTVTQIIAVVVAVTNVVAVVMVATKVDALVVATKEVATVTMTSPNWKFQSLPRQTQCPACTIGCDSQRSFQVFIHHSLQSIPACFYGG